MKFAYWAICVFILWEWCHRDCDFKAIIFSFMGNSSINCSQTSTGKHAKWNIIRRMNACKRAVLFKYQELLFLMGKVN
ncbi:hypothetical protein A9487_25980 [Bacillus cereus]|nr:hypothetical protein A9487_25980 [Bacillus cereus]